MPYVIFPFPTQNSYINVVHFHSKLLPTILSRMQSFTCLNYSFHPAYLRTMTTLKTSDYAILHSLNSNIYFITPQFIEEQYSPTLDLVNVFFTSLQAKRMEELYL